MNRSLAEDSIFPIKGKYGNYTEAFYNYLYFDPKEVFKGIKDKDRIKTMPIIILGTPGIGKTTLAKNIMLRINEWYSKYGVCSVYTNKADLETLMDYAFIIRNHLENKTPKVYIITFDDATGKKIKDEVVGRFFSIRHQAREEGGISEGIVYSIFLTHDWYSLDRLFRRYGNAAIILSVPPLDDYSRNHIKRLIGARTVERLQKIFVKASKEDKYKGEGYVRLPYVPTGHKTLVGFLKFKDVDVPYINIVQDSACKPFLEPVKLEFHVPVKKEKTDEEILNYRDRTRKQAAKRQRKKRAKDKERINEAKRRMQE